MAARNLSEGPIPKLIVVLALPVLATFVMQALYALVDLYFVGRLGGPALAGLGIALNTFFLILAVGQSIGTGAIALLSQAYGRGEHARVPVLFQQVFWLSLAIGLAFWLAGWLAAEPYVAAFTRDPAVLREGVAFLHTFSGTYFTSVVLFSLSFSFRAVGDFIVPTIMMALSVLLNVALDPLLIFGLGPVPALGVAGAGLATFIAQCAALAGYLWIVLGSKRNRLVVVRRPFTWNWKIAGQIFRIGIPSAVQNLLMMAGLLIMYRFLRGFGGEATAAVGVGFRVIQTAIFPGVAIASAVASLVGQNYGAGRYSRVRAALGWGVLYVTLVFSFEYAVILIQPRFWVSLFAQEPVIVDLGAQYLVITGAGTLPIYAASFIAIFGSQGLGRTMAPLVAGVLRTATGLALLVAADRWLDLTVPMIFWIGTIATVVEVSLMWGVLARLWRRVLHHADRPAGQPGGPAQPGSPAPLGEPRAVPAAE